MAGTYRAVPVDSTVNPVIGEGGGDASASGGPARSAIKGRSQEVRAGGNCGEGVVFFNCGSRPAQEAGRPQVRPSVAAALRAS